jgi:hypothetical protein
MLKTIDYDELNPGIRDLVRELREVHGLNTTDSGDGVTNVEAGMEGALEEKHVFILVQLVDMIETTRTLAKTYPDAWVECSWSPGQSANVMIMPDGLVLPPGVSAGF